MEEEKLEELLNEMLKERLGKLIDEFDEDCNVECEQEIEQFMNDNGVDNCKVSIDEMFDNPGCDVYSVAVAWVKNGIVELFVSSIEIS